MNTFESTLKFEPAVRMTKRIKQFKPKQQLQKSEVQTLVSILKSELESLEWTIGHYKFVAESLKGSDNDQAELYFKRTDKERKTRNKLAAIQHKLKKGLA